MLGTNPASPEFKDGIERFVRINNSCCRMMSDRIAQSFFSALSPTAAVGEEPSPSMDWLREVGAIVDDK
jgi:hypothetical protein